MGYVAVPRNPYASTLQVYGADLGDASATITPGTDLASLYVLRAVLTANRTVTLSNSGPPATSLLVIIRTYDTSANTLTINNAAATPLFTFAASPGAGVYRQIAFSFNGSAWVLWGDLEYIK